MKVMTSCVVLMRIMGFYTDKLTVQPVQLLKWIVYFACTLYIIVPEIIYLKVQASNIVDVSFALYISTAICGVSSQTLAFIVYRHDIRSFVITLEEYINQKAKQNGTKNFANTEHIFSMVSKSFIGLTMFSGTVYCIMPGFNQFLAFLTDSVTGDTYVASFRDMYYFWDASQSPAYEICYLLTSMAMFFMIIGFLAVDLFFVGICLYIKALYDELIYMIKQVDEHRASGDDREIQISNCINFHVDILGFIEWANRIYNSVIFIQFTYSLLTIVTCIMSGTYSGFTNLGVIIPNIMCFAGELFLFCWTGTMVLEEGNNLQRAAYSTCWYEYSNSEKKMLQLMILRTQKPNGMNAFQYFHCDNATFSAIISNVFSALAFLKNFV